MKIKRIHICNYRAFLINGDNEAARYIINLPSGENLLIYGENGSGKSSLFRAMKEFFISSHTPSPVFQRNLFYDEADNSEQPFIGITLDDDSEHFFSAETARTNTHETPAIADVGVTKGFIGYKDLLKLHFRTDDQAPDLFSFFLSNDGLFSGMIVPMPVKHSNKISFRDLWQKIKRTMDDEDLSDYNINAESQFRDVEEKANLLLRYFEKNCVLKIEYTEAKITDGVLNPPEISFHVSLFNKELSKHDEVLNEARLTAIAISVYLAHIFVIPDSDLKILFLDDIFIGLDMTNRIPLIKILTASDLGDGKSSFRDYQIFLTTYDREWFNLAGTYLDNHWNKIEFYVDSYSCNVERPLIRRSGTYKDRAEFHLIHGDYPACANYLRKAFEQVFREILPDNMLHPQYDSNDIENSLIIVSKNQLEIKETEDAWVFQSKSLAGDKKSLSRPIGLQRLIERFKILSNDYQLGFSFFDDLNSIKNRLLNPLSHHDLKSPVFKSELETGFAVLEELGKVKSRILVEVSGTDPVFLFYNRQDQSGNDYQYKFQLLENLRYIEYGGIVKLLNAECKPICRKRISDDGEEPSDGRKQRSIRDMCKGICIFSNPALYKKNFKIEETALLKAVYTETGNTLNDLL